MAKAKTSAKKTAKKAAPKKAVKKEAKKAAPKKAVKKEVKKAMKKAVKKTVKKVVKKVAKKVAKKKVVKVEKKLTAIREAMTKAKILMTIAEKTDLTKKQIGAVFDELSDLIERHVKKGGVGQFALPGLLKVSTVRKKATKARKGINPFTGEATVFKAKPACIKVKVKPLKKLKDMVS